jgi:hypothetical protein
MIGSGEAESRAVAGAVKGAVSQVRLDAGVNITGLLIDIDSAHDVDCRQHFMCWYLTRVLRPSLIELLPPAVVRDIVCRKTASPDESPLDGDGSALIDGDGETGLQRQWGPPQPLTTADPRGESGCQRKDDCLTVA